MSERQQFENKQVYLWGHKQASKSLLKEFDKGDQNPNKKRGRKQTDKKEEIPVIKEFEVGEDYGVSDLDFLNKEYERIDDELSKVIDLKEMKRLEDLQEKLYDLIEGLEGMKKITGGKIYKVPSEFIGVPFGNTFIDENYKDKHNIKMKYNPPKIEEEKTRGYGFKKGSPEALEHAKKMRDFKNKTVVKEVIKNIDSSKIRVEKGSEQAKSVGQRLAEARKAKAELRKKEEEMKKEEENERPPENPSKGKPYYYIGDIPKGYRKATMLEAIENKKVSNYGKFTVDETIYNNFKDYGILINPNPNNNELHGNLMAMKKKTLRELEDIEIFENKLENPKHKDRHDEFKTKLKQAKEKKKVFNAIYNFYFKIWSDRNNKPYQKIVFKKSEKPEIKQESSNDLKVHKTTLMTETERPEKEVYEFSLGDNRIQLDKKYFDSDKTLKSKYAERLFKKGIILLQQYYKPVDIHKYFFIEVY